MYKIPIQQCNKVYINSTQIRQKAWGMGVLTISFQYKKRLPKPIRKGFHFFEPTKLTKKKKKRRRENTFVNGSWNQNFLNKKI